MPEPNENSTANSADPAASTSAAAAAPAYVTPEQLQDTLKPVNASLEAVSRSLEALAAARSAPAAAPATNLPAPPTEEEVAEDLRNGSTKKLNALIDAKVQGFKVHELDPFRANGTAILTQLTSEIMSGDSKMPHYKRFKREIDTELAKLPAAQQALPEAHRTIYNIIVGRNADTLINEAREQAVRGQREKDSPATPGGSTGRTTTTNGEQVRSFEEVFGPDGRAALQTIVKTPDEFAKSQGFKDWADMDAEMKKQTAGKG